VPSLTAAGIEGPRWFFAMQGAGCALVLALRRHRPLVSMAVVCALLVAPLVLGWYTQSEALVVTLAVAVFATARYAALPRAGLALFLGPVVVTSGAFDPAASWASSWA
jgi:hypothetical protein